MKFGMAMGIGHTSYLHIVRGILLSNYTCDDIVKLEVYPANVSVKNLYLGNNFFITATFALVVVVVVVVVVVIVVVVVVVVVVVLWW